MTLEPGVNVERSGCWVHSSHKHATLDHFQGELSSVVPVFVVLVLPYECDSGLSIVFVKHWKIDVINEPDQFVLAKWTISNTSSLLDLLLEVDL